MSHPWNTTSAPKTIPTVCSLCGGKGCGHCVGSGPKIIYPGTSVIAPGCSIFIPATDPPEAQ